MMHRKLITALVLATTAGISAPALATGDAGVRHAQRLLEEARSFGKSETGEAAGQVRARREQHRDADTPRNDNERRWERVRKAQSLN